MTADLAALSRDKVIGVNASPLQDARLGRSADVYCVSDRRFLLDGAKGAIAAGAVGSMRVFAGYCAGIIADDDIHYVRILGGSGASADLRAGVYHGGSVVCFAAQIALWAGASRIVLHGCEHDYSAGRFYEAGRPDPRAVAMAPQNLARIVALARTQRCDVACAGPSSLLGDGGGRAVAGLLKLDREVGMQHIRTLDIKQDYIALFGSGPSVDAMDPAELDHIWSRCFTISLNYAPVALQSHLNMWSDRRVGDFLLEHYRHRSKDRLLLTQKAHARSLEGLVDYEFDRRADGLSGNFTLVWALQLIERYWPDKTVLLFGADLRADDPVILKWYDAHTDHDARHRGRGFDAARRLDQCKAQLAAHCRSPRIINCTPASALDLYDRKDWRDVLPLRVAQLTPSPLAGAPAHLSNIINRYTPHHSTSVLRMGKSAGRRSNLWWDYDISAPGPAELDSVIASADLIHLHGRPYPVGLQGKPALMQYHTPPGAYKPRRTHGEHNGRKLVIAQYHPRFYTDAAIVPNLIDIHDPTFRPDAKNQDRIKIFYSWATEHVGGWSDKGSRQTRDILSRIAARYGPAVEIVVMTDRPHDECMAQKRSADICIDECITGSYHLSSLEGCAVGAVTFNALDALTAGYIREVTGATSHPFQVTSINALEDQLAELIEDRALLRRRQSQAREWMETHWDPAERVKRFIRAYYDVLLYGRVGGSSEEGAMPVAQRAPIAQRRSGDPALASVSRRNPALAIQSLIRPPPAVRRVAYTAGAPMQHLGARQGAAREEWKNPRPVGQSHEGLFMRHAGREICVIGCGPSLFETRRAQLGDAVTIGINFAFQHLDALDYHAFHSAEVVDAVSGHLDHHRFLLPETLVRGAGGASAKSRREAPSLPAAFVYPLQNPYENSPARKHMEIRKDAAILTWTSAAHSALHLAAFMGASRIRLIGMDCRAFPDGRVHFDTPLMPAYGAQRWDSNARHRSGLDWAVRVLGAAGVEVIEETAPSRQAAV